MSFGFIEHPDTWKSRTRDEVLMAVKRLQEMHTQGMLGGEFMPEDSHPELPLGSAENYHYFTLPMALNYQRNSYALWRAAAKTYAGPETAYLFDPHRVSKAETDDVRIHLLKHRLAVQPRKHIDTWVSLCVTVCELLHGDIRMLFRSCGSDVALIRDFVQVANKQRFPYLSGRKICNYWLYVMDQYTDCQLQNRGKLTVAPDTHVIQATIILGILPPNMRDDPEIPSAVSAAWIEILAGTGIEPIDIHTPLWLWSRRGFRPSVYPS